MELARKTQFDGILVTSLMFQRNLRAVTACFVVPFISSILNSRLVALGSENHQFTVTRVPLEGTAFIYILRVFTDSVCWLKFMMPKIGQHFKVQAILSGGTHDASLIAE